MTAHFYKFFALALLALFFLALPASFIETNAAEPAANSIPALRDNPENPEQCLEMIQAAIDQSDAAAFERLVDIEAILKDALNVFTKMVKAGKIKADPMLAILFSQAAGQKEIADLLINESRAFALNGISSGSFAGKAGGTARIQSVLSPLYAGASLGQKKIMSIGDVKRDADGWTVPFVLRDYGNGEDYTAIGKFVVDNGSCRLKAIENLEQLLEEIEKERISQNGQE